MRESTLSRVASDAAGMRAIGARLASGVLAVDPSEPLLITLSGELGAGKTTLVGGLLAALGHHGPVRSPTYSLIEPYRLADRDIHHCDLYRLRDPDELDELGLRDLMTARAVLLIEWPERAGDRLRAPDIALLLQYVEGGRAVALTAWSTVGKTVLAQLRLDPA